MRKAKWCTVKYVINISIIENNDNSHDKNDHHRNNNNNNSQNNSLNVITSATSQKVDNSVYPQKEPSNTLIVSNLGIDINLSILEDVFREKCLDLQTSMPDEIRFLESLRVAYVSFPSIPVSTKIFQVIYYYNPFIIVFRWCNFY